MNHPPEIQEALQKIREYEEALRKVKKYKKRRKQLQKTVKESLKRLSPHFISYLVTGDEKHLEKLKALEKLRESFSDVLVEDDELSYALALLHQLKEFRRLLRERVKTWVGSADKISTVAKTAKGV